MDWAHVLIWIVCIATGLNILLMLRARTPLRSHWMWVQVGIFGITLGGSALHQKGAALIGGTLWFALVLGPSLLARYLFRLSSGRKYKRALQVNRLLSRIHPSKMLQGQRALLEVLQHISEGQAALAQERLEQMSQEPGPMQSTAIYFSYYLRNDWEGLQAHLNEEIAQQEDGEPNGSQSFWMLRCLAETGQLAAMVEYYQQSEQQGWMASDVTFEVWAILMAFTGRVEIARELLRGPLYRWSPHSKDLLLASAHLASGQEREATRLLEALVEEGDPIIKARASSRMERGAVDPGEALEASHQEAIDALVERIHRDLKYTGLAHLHLRPWWTWGFALLLLLVYGISEWAGGSTNGEVLMAMGAMVPVRVIKWGEYWRLFAFPLLHYGFIHFSLNLIALLLFGPFIERSLGAFRFCLLLFLSAVGGGCLIAAVAYLNWSPRYLLSAYVGASGAIFGLIGSMLVIMLKGWWQEKALLARRRIGILLLIVGLQTLFDLSTPSVSLGAHWSGLLLGAAFTALAWRPAAQKATLHHKS